MYEVVKLCNIVRLVIMKYVNFEGYSKFCCLNEIKCIKLSILKSLGDR